MKSCLAVAAALAIAATGCGGGDTRQAEDPPPKPRPPRERVKTIEPVRCPSGAANCRSATGRVMYVEAVDPDGDGDAHFVLASPQSVTGPGITVVDVERRLRPRPLPRNGDLIAAAGPVFRGSHGQRQIEADVLRVRRR